MKLELGCIIKLSKTASQASMFSGLSPSILKITKLRTDSDSLYHGKLIFENRTVTFFEFQVTNNFGIIEIQDFIKNYPEHLI